MIGPHSRYAGSPAVTAPGASGEDLALLELRDPPPPGGAVLHTPAAGERLDHIAHRYFRDPTAFWRICDASDVLDPFDLVAPGRPVRIPSRR